MPLKNWNRPPAPNPLEARVAHLERQNAELREEIARLKSAGALARVEAACERIENKLDRPASSDDPAALRKMAEDIEQMRKGVATETGKLTEATGESQP